jgi:hypothetical protein
MGLKMQKQKILAATALFVGSTFAANATTPSSTGCVDSATMSTCLDKAQTTLTECIAVSGGNDDVIISCGWQDNINQMLCYQSSCWNKVLYFTCLRSGCL